MSRVFDILTADNDAVDHVSTHDFIVKKSANYVLWAIGGFFVLLLLWATFTKIDRTVHGAGRVVPSSKMQVVSNLEGGVVEQILVKPGQSVKRGDVLVRLSPALTSAEMGSNAASMEALQARVIRLGAEIRGQSPDFSGLPQDIASTEEAVHIARMAELASISSAGNARATQTERGVAEARSIVESRKANLSAAERELAMLRPLAEKQIVSQLDLVKAENAVTVAQNDMIASTAVVARSQAGIAEARAAAAQARSDWMSRAGMELATAQAELAARRSTMTGLTNKVDRTLIRAPMTGKVNRVLVTTVGGSVGAGMPVAEIVPTEDALYIEAQVRPQDIANVRLGQKATVEITAYRAAVFGTLDGTVTTISPDAVLNEKTGESFYTVEVRTTTLLQGDDGKRLDIGPGMIANVSLLGDKRSVLSYFFSPITRLSERAFTE